MRKPLFLNDFAYSNNAAVNISRSVHYLCNIDSILPRNTYSGLNITRICMA